MYEIKELRLTEWNSDLGHDYNKAEKEILSILKEQKASLTMARTLFKGILDKIEDKNIINL